MNVPHFPLKIEFSKLKLPGGMFFLLRAIIKFLWRYLSHKLFQWEVISENINTTLCKLWLYKSYKSLWRLLLRIQNRQKTQKAQKDKKKTSFPKEKVENRDWYKPVLNKVMTTQEQCIKQNFVAPLNWNKIFKKIKWLLAKLRSLW